MQLTPKVLENYTRTRLLATLIALLLCRKSSQLQRVIWNFLEKSVAPELSSYTRATIERNRTTVRFAMS